MNAKKIGIESFKFENTFVNRKGLGLTGENQAPSFSDYLSYEKKENIGGII